ncbi:unnamed protein product [Lupinus luteus]|uniref:Uncharacterized protein n=1 Tax=Lupinus luteus TaxID=3873 RepID=A0AAV1XYU4_LUPLU
MSEKGEWTLENDRCTHNGPCHLELELKSSGSTMRLPSHHTQLEASFTLPRSRPPREVTLSETRIPGIRVVGESSTRQTRYSDDLNSLPYVRAARRSFPNFDGDATNEPMSQDSANEEMEDDECDEEDCVELVDFVDSIEEKEKIYNDSLYSNNLPYQQNDPTIVEMTAVQKSSSPKPTTSSTYVTPARTDFYTDAVMPQDDFNQVTYKYQVIRFSHPPAKKKYAWVRTKW